MTFTPSDPQNGPCGTSKAKSDAKIPFNRPYLTGRELEFIEEALESRHLAGDGRFTRRCQSFFEQRYGFGHTFLTASCTDALEMCALLTEVGPGDEVIIPSYTFVSTANAFALRGATIRFADSLPENPNIDPAAVRRLINPRTKVVVVVHYGGVACDMAEILAIAKEHNLIVVEDAAQAIDSTYRGKPLGSLGDLSAFSFHETKNLQCGQGGLAVVNNSAYVERAEVLWQKGTNRSQFLKGKVDKYRWVDLGSSFLPGETVAAFLWAQLCEIDEIQRKRCHIWDTYCRGLKTIPRGVRVPDVSGDTSRNGHLFYLVFEKHGASPFIRYAAERGVQATSHYLSLHNSPFFKTLHDERTLPWSDFYTDSLVRLPLYCDLATAQIEEVISVVADYVETRL